MSFYNQLEKIISLKKGDYISAHNIKEPAHFKTQTKTHLLYISSNPVFSSAAKDIQELMNIARAVAKKDLYTERHCERVQNLCMRLGEAFSLPPDKIELLTYAGYLHDIGKAYVPEEILGKPGKLTPEEREIIKKHPTVGRQMLEKTFIKDAGSIVEQHHERIDGSGYPRGLKGDRVSVEGQIVGIVDVYETLSDDRPYRSALSKKEIIQRLKSMAGVKFDKRIVDALLNILMKHQQFPFTPKRPKNKGFSDAVFVKF